MSPWFFKCFSSDCEVKGNYQVNLPSDLDQDGKLSEPGSQRQPSEEDIKAAIWEICGNTGALQLLVDLLATKTIELEEGSGTEACDTQLLKEFSKTVFPLEKEHCGLREHAMTKNRWAVIIYRRGQKQLAHSFLEEAQNSLQLCLSEE